MTQTNMPLQTDAADAVEATIVLPRSIRPVAIVVGVVLVAVIIFAATRGASPVVETPTAAPSTLATQDPHLPGDATAQQVFAGLNHAGLQVTAHTATAGTPDGPVVRKIFASYLGWPLDVTEYRSASLLTKAETWPSGAEPEYGDPPLTVAGGNILIIWGPVLSGRAPALPDDRQKEGFQALVSALEPLLAPIKAKSSLQVVISAPIVVATPAPTAAPSTAASAKPAKSPKPKPTPKPTPKP